MRISPDPSGVLQEAAPASPHPRLAHLPASHTRAPSFTLATGQVSDGLSGGCTKHGEGFSTDSHVDAGAVARP
ncbi:unnamed protein product [Urochloa humidicola]